MIRGWLVGIIFFILGVGTLLPWNFFMTASMTERSNGTVVSNKEYYFNNWMTLLSQLPLLLCTLLNSFFYQRISEMVRIAGSLVFIFILFILTAILVKIPMEEDRFFSVTMATIWFINSFGAVLQGSLFGLVGLLPQKYSAVFMSGQGLAGTFAAIAMLVSIASDTDPETAALGYFITPCVGTLITLLSYLLLPRLEFSQFYLDKSRSYEVETTDELLKVTESVTAENGNLYGDANDSLANGGASGEEVDVEGAGASPKQAFLTLEQAEDRDRKSTIMEVFKKIWVMAFCVVFVFTVTLAPPKESRLFPGLVVSRVVFVPLLMLCNVQSRSYLPVLFSHDAAFAFIMTLFSLSSGYCVCLSMSYAPQLVAPKDAETAGALMTFFLALGLSIGAGLSFLLRLLV
ncbi:unnamed protein product [Coregonus sp. 'balchen']|nr:unnamed protein product [Coregonus sp. 'balchen']